MKFDGDYEQMNVEDCNSFDELFGRYYDSRTLETYDITYDEDWIHPELMETIIQYAIHYHQDVFLAQDFDIDYARVIICKDVLAMAYADFMGYNVSNRDVEVHS